MDNTASSGTNHAVRTHVHGWPTMTAYEKNEAMYECVYHNEWRPGTKSNETGACMRLVAMFHKSRATPRANSAHSSEKQG